jgi:hypothetical protein
MYSAPPLEYNIPIETNIRTKKGGENMAVTSKVIAAVLRFDADKKRVLTLSKINPDVGVAQVTGITDALRIIRGGTAPGAVLTTTTELSN